MVDRAEHPPDVAPPVNRRPSLPTTIETVDLEKRDHVEDPTDEDVSTSKTEDLSDKEQNWPSSWPWHFFSLLVSFLWLTPIITLLVLNLKDHVIGASVWCPFGKCPSNAFNSHAIPTAVRLDHKDHDVRAGLQYVAQAFEIWFLFIATSLLFDVSMLFARSKQGLPVGLFLTHVEFNDVKALSRPYLWTSAFSNRTRNGKRQGGRRTTKLFFLVLLTATLTVLTNLMGAAVAVLLLPSLSWVETEKVPQARFESIATGLAPHENAVFPGSCSNFQLLAGNFSCASGAHGPSLDEWAAKAQSSIRQYEKPNGIAILATSQEAAVQFSLNASDDLELIWIANRQVLRDVSKDYMKATGQCRSCFESREKADIGTPDPRFSNSLQTFLQRTGPSLGVQTNCFVGNETVTKVGPGKEIHCFDGWSVDDEHHYTKCLRIGQAFSNNNNHSRFWLASTAAQEPPIAVDSYFSDHATFYNSGTDFFSNITTCLARPSPACDWDAIFDVPLPSAFYNSSVNTGLTSYSIPDHHRNSQARIYCDATTYLDFPTYSLDTSMSSNELHLVQLDNLRESNIKTQQPLVVSPDWYLAAWTVDRNGTVDGSRLITRELRRALQAFFIDQSDSNALQLFLYHIYTLGQALSLVPYSITPPISSPSHQNQTSTHPLLHTSAQLHVWLWSLSGRTSKLGVVITVLGCIVVLARLFVGVGWPRREYSPVDILDAALEWSGDGERRGGGDVMVDIGREGAKERARRMWRIKDGEGGRLRFVRPQL